MNTTTQNPAAGNPHSLIKLGLDVDLQQITATVQYDHQHPKPAQSFTVARLLQWVREKVAAGHTVHTVYEYKYLTRTKHRQSQVACHRTQNPAFGAIVPQKPRNKCCTQGGV